MDEALRRYAASGALPSQHFRDLVSRDPPTIGAIKDHPTSLGTYLCILRVLLRFAQLWDTSRQFNFGDYFPDMVDFAHHASMIGIRVYGEDTKRLPEAVIVEKVDELRRDLIAGTHPLLVTMRLPTIAQALHKTVRFIFRWMMKAPVLGDIPLQAAITLWKAWEKVGWYNLSPWQQIYVTLSAFKVKHVLVKHNVPMPDERDYSSVPRESVYFPARR